VKSGPIAFPPRRVIVWNALPTPAVRHDGESRPEPLLAHLLHRSLELGAVPVDLTLLSEQASTWQNLFGATMRGTIPLENGEPAQIGTFDTFVLFAHLSSSDDKPEEVWLRLSPDKEPTPVPATTLLEKLGEKWRFSRVVIETVADERRTGCLKATTALAARMARSLGVPVVGVCHTPQYAAAAKGMAEGQGFMPSFTGELLAALVQPDVRLDQAARQARRNLSEGLDFRDSVHVGLPIICRPERITRTRPSRPAPTTPGPPR